MIFIGKTAIVTGGSRGIGRAICRLLAERGADVVINYAGNEEQAKITLAQCPNAVLARGDVSRADECEAVFNICEQAFGPPDILINNAGITRDGLIMRMNDADFDRVMDVNLRGAFNTTRLACRPMLRRKSGRIVNITSVVGLAGNAGQSVYSASKAGIIGMTKSVALEMASRGITVNAVAPGFIETDMTDALPEAVREKMLAGIPAGKFGGVNDVAEAVLFLCSDEAAYITGQVLSVNGGMYM